MLCTHPVQHDSGCTAQVFQAVSWFHRQKKKVTNHLGNNGGARLLPILKGWHTFPTIPILV